MSTLAGVWAGFGMKVKDLLSGSDDIFKKPVHLAHVGYVSGYWLTKQSGGVIIILSASILTEALCSLSSYLASLTIIIELR